MERIKVEFDSNSRNEQFARVVTAVFLSRIDPTVEELEDIKTAVSEAVTNAVIHGYDGREGRILLEAWIESMNVPDEEGKNREKGACQVTVMIQDQGVGIGDIKKAMEPLYTSKPSKERSGMGFTFMEAFMDEVCVESEVGKGTKVTMKKKIDR